MNRTLKRPMFRMGGSAGTGITSGLDQPRKQYNQGTNPYAMGNFQSTGLPGFLTSFGLNLLSTPPRGNIFSTAAIAAQDPFRRLQADQASAMKTASDRAFARELAEEKREFLTDERIASDKSAMDRLLEKIKSDEKIAGMKTTEDPLYNISLESYIEDGLPPTTAKRAANFQVTFADDLRRAVGGTRFGGVLNFDIRDPNNQKQVKKFFNNKVVYDPYEDNYKYIVIRNGEVFFDEFNSIADIKFPDLTVTPKEKTKPELVDPFSPNIEDIQGS